MQLAGFFILVIFEQRELRNMYGPRFALYFDALPRELL